MFINNETKKFVTRLKADKAMFGLKYKDVSKAIGINTNFLYHIVGGDRNLPEKYWSALEEYLNEFEQENNISLKIVVEKIGG